MSAQPPSEWHYVAAAYLVVFVALYQFELLGKRLDAKLRELRELLT